MLINDFFKIITIENTDDSIISTIELNSSHQIFDGHFPSNPITPGVVQIQIVKELLSKILKKECLLKEMGRCKFLAILNPVETPQIIIKIDYSLIENNWIKVSAQGSSIEEDQTFFKFTAKYS